jgi:tellurite resistance protein
MFISVLSESEKQAFLCLAHKVIASDGVIANSETAVFNGLASELRLTNLESSLSERESYDVFSSSSEAIKRAVYIELLSLAIADGVFDASEKEYMKAILSKLGLPDSFAEKAGKWLSEYFSILKVGINLVEEN